MGTNEWDFLGAEALGEVVDRLGRETFGEKWPSPPTENAVRTEAERRLKLLDNDPAPRQFPSLPRRDRSVDEYIGPDPRKIAPTSIDSVASPFQLDAREAIIEDLYDTYNSERARIGKSIFSKLQSDLFKGIKRALIVKPDGAYTVPPKWWSGNNARKAMEEGEFRGCIILLKIEKTTASTPSKNNVRIDCQQWLEGLRRDNPDRYPDAFRTKEDIEDEAIRRFNGLKPYGFKTAWAKAASSVPLPSTSGWGKPGAKKKTEIE